MFLLIVNILDAEFEDPNVQRSLSGLTVVEALNNGIGTFVEPSLLYYGLIVYVFSSSFSTWFSFKKQRSEDTAIGL